MLLIQLIIIPPHLASPPLGERDLHAPFALPGKRVGDEGVLGKTGASDGGG
jgi:hypothetical protein